MSAAHAFALGIIVCLLAIVLIAEWQNYREESKETWR